MEERDSTNCAEFQNFKLTVPSTYGGTPIDLVNGIIYLHLLHSTLCNMIIYYIDRVDMFGP